VVSVGTMITFAWRIVSTFLDPGTVFKIRLVDNFNDKALLEDFTAPRIRDLEQSTEIAPGQPIPRLPNAAPAQASAAASSPSMGGGGGGGGSNSMSPVSGSSNHGARSPRMDSVGSDDDLATSFHSAQGRESTEHDSGTDAAASGAAAAAAAANTASTSGVPSLEGTADDRGTDTQTAARQETNGIAVAPSNNAETGTTSSINGQSGNGYSGSRSSNGDKQRRSSPVPGMNDETLAKLRESVRMADRAAGGPPYEDGDDDDDDDDNGSEAHVEYGEGANRNGGNGGSSGGADGHSRPGVSNASSPSPSPSLPIPRPRTLPITDALVAQPATVAAVQDTLEALMRAQGNPSVKPLPEEEPAAAATTTTNNITGPLQLSKHEAEVGLNAAVADVPSLSSKPPLVLEEVCLREGDLFKRGKRSGLWSSRRCVLLTDAAANDVTGKEGAIAQGSSSSRGPRLAVRKGSGPAEDLLKGQRMLWLRGGHVALGKSGPYFTVEVSAGPTGKTDSAVSGNGSSSDGNGASEVNDAVPTASSAVAEEEGSFDGGTNDISRSFSHRSSSGSNLARRTSTSTTSSTVSSGEVDTFAALGSKVQAEAEAWAKALEDCLSADAHALRAARDDVTQRAKAAQAAATQAAELKAAQEASANAAAKAQANASVKGQTAAAAHAATVAALQAPLGSGGPDVDSNGNSSGSSNRKSSEAYTAELAAEVLLLRNWQRAASAVATRKDNAFHDLLLAHLDALAELRNASDALNAAAAEATATAAATAAAAANAAGSSSHSSNSQAVQQSPSADAAARYVRSLRPAGSTSAKASASAPKPASQAPQQQQQQQQPQVAPSVPAASAASSAATALAARAERTRQAYADAGEALAVHTGAEAERKSVTMGPASGSEEGRRAEEQRLGKRARARAQWQASMIALRKRYTLGARPLLSTPASAVAANAGAAGASAASSSSGSDNDGGSTATAFDILASMWPRAVFSFNNSSDSAGAAFDPVAFPRDEEEWLLAQREAAFDTSCRCVGAAEVEVRSARLALQSLGGRVAAQALELDALRAWHVAASSLADDKDAQYFAAAANVKALRSQVQQLGYTPREAPTSGFHFHTQANTSGGGSSNGRTDSEARRSSLSGLGHIPGLHQFGPAVVGLGAAGTRQLAGLAGHGAAGTLKLAGFLGQPLGQFNSRAPSGEEDVASSSSSQPLPQPPSPSPPPASSSLSPTPPPLGPSASPPRLPPPANPSSTSSAVEVATGPTPPPPPPPALDAPARGATNAPNNSTTSSVGTNSSVGTSNSAPPKLRDRIGRFTRPFSKTSSSSSARTEASPPSLQIPDRPSSRPFGSGHPANASASSGTTAPPSPPPSASSTLAGWRTGTVVLNGAKIWVSDARNPLTVVHALLDAARGVFAVARGADAAPAPLPLGPFRGAGGRANSSNGSSNDNSDLASLAAGGPSWGAAVRSVGAVGFATARSSAAFKELTLDAAELQRLDLSLLTRRATQTSSDSSSSSSSSSSATPASDGATQALPAAAAAAAPAPPAPPAPLGPPPGPNAVESFYHAMVNLAVLHATVALEGPSLQDLTNPEGLAGKVGYNLGGSVVTIADLMSSLKSAGLPPEPVSPTAYEF